MQGRTRRGGGPKLTKYQKQRIMGRPEIKKGVSVSRFDKDTQGPSDRFRGRQGKANKPTPKTGGSPNQKFKDEQKKKRELRIKNRNINRPGTDPVKTPTGVNKPGTSDKKKVVRNKIKSLSGDFIKKVLMFGLPIGPTYFATEQLYKEFLKKKKMKI